MKTVAEFAIRRRWFVIAGWIVLVVAAVCARFWRTVLLMIMISLLIFTVLGLFAGLHDMQHLVR